MNSTRQRALEAAVTLVGTEGVRALTHGRVDAAASLPPGSTSNHFRTRAALVAGVIDWLAAAERGDVDDHAVASEVDLVDLLTRMIELESGPLATRTRARYALFLEADEDSAAPLRAQRKTYEGWVRGILTSLGGPAAAEHTSFLMATGDGLLLHRVTVDPGAPIRPVVAAAVRTALQPSAG